MACVSLCFCVCVCLGVVFDVLARYVCEISCGDVWCSMYFYVCVSCCVLCGVVASYCVMLCGMCSLCDVCFCVLCADVA